MWEFQPTNNKGRHQIGLISWMLAREVIRLRGTLADRETEWDVTVDLYFYLRTLIPHGLLDEFGRSGFMPLCIE